MPNWNESKPQSSDRVRELGAVVRDNKAHLDAALQKHFYWSDSTLSAGIPRFSDATGTFRTYWGAASSFSTSGDDGRLMITADGATTWSLNASYASLRATRTVGAVTLSSANVLVRDAAGGAGANDTRYVIDTGTAGGARASGTYKNDFTAPFTSAPAVFITSADKGARYIVAVSAIGTSNFSSQESCMRAETSSSSIIWWAVGPIAI